MDLIIIIVVSMVILYISSAYKAYVYFRRHYIRTSFLFSCLIPIIIIWMNMRIAKEQKTSRFKMILKTFVKLDLFLIIFGKVFDNMFERYIKDRNKHNHVRVRIKFRMELNNKENVKKYEKNIDSAMRI